MKRRLFDASPETLTALIVVTLLMIIIGGMLIIHRVNSPEYAGEVTDWLSRENSHHRS